MTNESIAVKLHMQLINPTPPHWETESLSKGGEAVPFPEIASQHEQWSQFVFSVCYDKCLGKSNNKTHSPIKRFRSSSSILLCEN